jgi:hypothetical protein
VTRTLDRRPVALACAAALALALFSARAFGQQVAGNPPLSPLELALQRVKQDLKPAVIILVPEEATAKETLAARLTGLVSGNRRRQARALEFLFAEAVFVCAPAAQVHKTFPTTPPTATVLLIGPEGKPVASLADGPGLFEEGFVPQMTELLHGRRGERLAVAAKAQRRSLGDLAAQVDVALHDLDSDLFRKREAASGFLAGTAERSTAVLVEARLKAPSLEAKRRLERLLDGVLANAVWQFGSNLPYGVRWGEAPEEGCPGNGQANALGAVIGGSGPGRPCLRFVTEMRPQ